MTDLFRFLDKFYSLVIVLPFLIFSMLCLMLGVYLPSYMEAFTLINLIIYTYTYYTTVASLLIRPVLIIITSINKYINTFKGMLYIILSIASYKYVGLVDIHIIRYIPLKYESLYKTITLLIIIIVMGVLRFILRDSTKHTSTKTVINERLVADVALNYNDNGTFHRELCDELASKFSAGFKVDKENK